LPLQHVFVAWKDTREARRAVADALPLLEAAGHTGVLEITSEADYEDAKARVRDVGRWLETHGVSATPRAVGTTRLEMGYLHAELLSLKCDLLVAGAYGHNRVGEWVFGGVTQDVLLDPDFCVLLSH
jgi:nucleotide-binding universal stress UspA family protein